MSDSTQLVPDGALVTAEIRIVEFLDVDGTKDYALDVPEDQENGQTRLLLTFGEWWLIEQLVRDVMEEGPA